MTPARVPAIALTVVAVACLGRSVGEPYGYCGPYIPPDAQPALVAFERGTPGELRVRGGNDHGRLLMLYRLKAAGDTATVLETVSDTGFVLAGLRAGRYSLRALAIGHHPLGATFDFGPDTGVITALRLERGALSMCEDGIRPRRLPWWRFW